ncbi:PaaI family thioesterase [Variovorax guangxiensis]|uniref:PaaI family thioesterase n=1 Tax=Variovorax guangxiensis TaxID=1775474 RepID=UPI0028641987|nr:PaaI family thioesterase [Variovorax guangxiensis]MDR6858786.1 acyl-coenzyme A thioesterase PaaI-like protein [Variovorax guangxiensis]
MTDQLSSQGAQAPQVRRVLQALRANRTPGWQFAGHYLGLSFDQLAPDRGRVSMPLGSHCHNSQGRVALAAVAVLADVAMTAALRVRGGADSRMATVSTRLSFAQAANAHRLVAHAQRQFSPESLAMPLAITTFTIEAAGAVCCTGEATFAVLPNRRGTAPHPLPHDNSVADLVPLAPEELSGAESEVLARALRADGAPEGPYSFLERFWEMVPQSGEGWAECRIGRGLHVGNRVGDVQGGILLGLAAQTSAAVLPQGWTLADLSAQFLAASSGPSVCARAEARRVGRNVANIECRITDDAGHTTLTAQATLARMA